MKRLALQAIIAGGVAGATLLWSARAFGPTLHGEDPALRPAADLATRQRPSESEQIAYVLQAINRFRISKGLAPSTTNAKTCTYAQMRARDMSKGFNHQGFMKDATGFYGGGVITENLGEGYDFDTLVPGWIASPGHNRNLRADTPFICVAHVGRYWVMEGWKP